PPCLSCSAIWLCTHSPTKPSAGSKRATAVSSHELSSARIISRRPVAAASIGEKPHSLQHRHRGFKLSIHHRLKTKSFFERLSVRDVRPGPLAGELRVLFRRHHDLHVRR